MYILSTLFDGTSEVKTKGPYFKHSQVSKK